MSDENQKDYYAVFSKEVIDILKFSLTQEEFEGFLKGSIIKYSLRAGFKTDDPTEDYNKRNYYVKLLKSVVSEAAKTIPQTIPV